MFFHFCGNIIERDGYFMHKYNPDGTIASSWHPYLFNGRPRLPIQEDETALIIWSLWHHFNLTRSIESIRDLYNKLITPAANFLTRSATPRDCARPVTTCGKSAGASTPTRSVRCTAR